jgi:UDP-glucuronate 4-epimerase
MRILLTGAAGFIGHHTSRRLLERGDTVLGLDNMNDYNPVALKRSRLAQLDSFERFRFVEADIADPDALEAAVAGEGGFDAIVHLAAQAGVRHSVEKPLIYVHSNVTGQVAMFELAARLSAPIVYASSSSIYGANRKVPFSEDDRVDQPVSVYAATKRAGELLAQAYVETRGVVSAGLRFFTVYGRFGRPDMAPWLFTDAILQGRPITVYNDGEMERDFTHVSDIVSGVVAAADRIVERPAGMRPIYNLGNNRPVKLLDFIGAIESAAGRRAQMVMKPRPVGDMIRTFADIDHATADLGYRPEMRLEDGMADFVDWFRGYNGSAKG